MKLIILLYFPLTRKVLLSSISIFPWIDENVCIWLTLKLASTCFVFVCTKRAKVLFWLLSRKAQQTICNINITFGLYWVWLVEVYDYLLAFLNPNTNLSPSQSPISTVYVFLTKPHVCIKLFLIVKIEFATVLGLCCWGLSFSFLKPKYKSLSLPKSY